MNKLFLILLLSLFFINQTQPKPKKKIINKILKNFNPIADINKLINYFQEPNNLLIKSAEINDIANVKVALNKGANINTRDIYGNTALHLSTSNNNIEITKLLLEQPKYNTEIKNNSGNRPLHVAAIKGSIDCAKILISRNAYVDSQNVWLRTPLHIAAIKKNIEMIRLLIQAEANNKIKDSDNLTPMNYATKKIREIIKREKIQQRLLMLKIQRLEKKERQRKAKEEQIIYKKNITIIQSQLRKLLQKGKNNEEKKLIIQLQSQLRKKMDQDIHKILIHITRFKKELEYRKKYFLYELDNFLLNINGPINKLPTKKEILNEFKKILFMQNLSTKEKFKKIRSFKHLTKKFTDMDGNTALHLFAMYGKYRFIPALILNGADINAQNHNGETPLFLAVEVNNFITVQTLIYLGANPNIESSEVIESKPGIYPASYSLSQTPLDVAILTKNNKIINLLKSIDPNFQAMQPEGTFNVDVESDSRLVIDLDEIYNKPFHATSPTLIPRDSEAGPIIKEKINRLIEWLQANQDINFSKRKNKTKNNIFHYLAKYNHPQITKLVKVFLNLGIKLNRRNKKGLTPLQIALISGNLNMAQTFIHFGARIVKL